MNEPWVQIITIIVSNLAIILTFFGISISLHNRMDAKFDKFSERIESNLRGIQEEMKDFHERLLKIEMDRKRR